MSAEEGAGLTGQAQAAIKFLSRHEREFERLKAHGVDNLLLDFGVEVGDEIQRSEYLPPELLMAMAKFKMGIIFSAIRIPRG